MKNLKSIHSIPENHSFNSYSEYSESDRTPVKKGSRARKKVSRARDNRWNKYEENLNEYELDRIPEIHELDVYRHIKQFNDRTESY